MKNKIIIFATVVLLTVFSLKAQYQNRSDQYLNNFSGPVDLRIHKFAQQLSLDIIAPTASILGYAHKPTSGTDKRMVEELYNKMQNYFRFINVSQDGQCNFEELDLDNPFFSFYINEFEAEYLNKFDEERGQINQINRNSLNRYNSSPQRNYGRLTRSKSPNTSLSINPYYFSMTKSTMITSSAGKYQRSSINDRKNANRAKYFLNDKRLTQNDIKEKQNFEYIYDLGNLKRNNSSSSAPRVPQPIQRQENYNYVPQQSLPQQNNFDFRQRNKSYGQSPHSRNNYKIAKEELNQYNESMPTETDISIRFLCNYGESLSYVDLREFFDTFPKVRFINTQVVTDEGQYFVELDKQNSTVYLR